MTDSLLAATEILDFNHHNIQSLLKQRGWAKLPVYERIGAIYHFVKDEIRFGYNRTDDLKASEILTDGYGQCNTKSTLFMALLRGSGIPCRLHGFTVEKTMQGGAIPKWILAIAPKLIIHSWVEIEYDGRWLELEGFILDDDYLSAIKSRFPAASDNFCGFAIATNCMSNPKVNWQGESTYIQDQSIEDDYGLYDDPDSFYAKHGTNLKGIRRWMYQNVLRHIINNNVNKLRHFNGERQMSKTVKEH